MIKLCLLITILGMASAGLMIKDQVAKLGCNPDYVEHLGWSERHDCPRQFIKNTIDPSWNYCEDPSCPGGMQKFGKEYPERYQIVCCRESCNTFDCDGAFLKDEKCKVTGKARTEDYGKTWKCQEDYYPKCPGGSVYECAPRDIERSPNGTVTLFGKEFCCGALSCTFSDSAFWLFDKDAWSWKCIDQVQCSYGDFGMKYIEKRKRWECISETCPEDQTEMDRRRNKWYCQAEVDCISEALFWNNGTKSWECPKMYSDTNTTTDQKLEKLISKVNTLEQKIDYLIFKKI